MKLLVGLGNPGTKYAQTRHNLGFVVLDQLANRSEDQNEKWKKEEKFQSEVFNYTLNAKPFTLLKPHTFMNNSGKAVQSYASYYKIDPQDIAVIYDDIDLPTGKLRVRFGGNAGGHRGVQSIIDSLGTDEFLRIRLGIGVDEQPTPTEDFVLSSFQPSEEKEVRKMIDNAVEAVELLIENGIEKYLSTFHGK